VKSDDNLHGVFWTDRTSKQIELLRTRALHRLGKERETDRIMRSIGYICDTRKLIALSGARAPRSLFGEPVGRFLFLSADRTNEI